MDLLLFMTLSETIDTIARQDILALLHLHNQLETTTIAATAAGTLALATPTLIPHATATQLAKDYILIKIKHALQDTNSFQFPTPAQSLSTALMEQILISIPTTHNKTRLLISPPLTCLLPTAGQQHTTKSLLDTSTCYHLLTTHPFELLLKIRKFAVIDTATETTFVFVAMLAKTIFPTRTLLERNYLALTHSAKISTRLTSVFQTAITLFLASLPTEPSPSSSLNSSADQLLLDSDQESLERMEMVD